MRITYIDDSGDQNHAIFSALIIEGDHWRAIGEAMKNYRRSIKQSDGILIGKELHACEFVKGRGRLGDTVVSKARRYQIFREILAMIATMEGLSIINAAGGKDSKLRLFERLMNRVNRNCEAQGTKTILVCDEGNEAEYVRLCRKMGVYNFIGSKYGGWGDGAARNVPTSKILEDPFFRSSNQSTFIQLADFCAYSLLQFERGTSPQSTPDIHKSFELLDKVLVKQAFQRDPKRLGIIRD